MSKNLQYFTSYSEYFNKLAGPLPLSKLMLEVLNLNSIGALGITNYFCIALSLIMVLL